MAFRVDYERMENNPGFCRILYWEYDATKSIQEAFPSKSVYEENVPQDNVVRRVGEVSNKLNEAPNAED